MYQTPRWLIAGLVLATAGCGEVGSLQITTATTGEVPLALGSYRITVDATQSQSIEPNETIVVGDLFVGDHDVALSELSTDCAAVDATTRSVEVLAQGTTNVTFNVDCQPTLFFADTLELCQTCTVDLDAGLQNILGPPSELWFQAVTDTERYLAAYEDARMGAFGMISPSKGGCVETPVRAAPHRVPVGELTTGTFLCVFTNERRWSEVEILAEACPTCGSMMIGFRTFQSN